MGRPAGGSAAGGDKAAASPLPCLTAACPWRACLRSVGAGPQLVSAKRRLAESFVVLEMDWLHLAAPLLCARLGLCEPSVSAALRAAGATGAAACGLEATLAGLGMGEGERGEVAGLLARRNALDLELYAFARRLVRSLCGPRCFGRKFVRVPKQEGPMSLA